MPYDNLAFFLLIFVRITSFFFVLPVFSQNGIPNLVKIGLSVVMSYLIFNGLSFETEMGHDLVTMFSLCIGELLIGVTLGFVTLLALTIPRIAMQFIDRQIGFLMSGVFDPHFGEQVTLMGRFYYLLGVTYFFAINAHHGLIGAFAGSFHVAPVGLLYTIENLTVLSIVEVFVWSFVFAFQIALPIIAVLLLTDISMGLISKTVPQLHVFIVGLPLKIGAGLLVMFVILPYMGGLFQNIFNQMNTEIINLTRTFL